jgi:hypothetical protein
MDMRFQKSSSYSENIVLVNRSVTDTPSRKENRTAVRRTLDVHSNLANSSQIRSQSLTLKNVRCDENSLFIEDRVWLEEKLSDTTNDIHNSVIQLPASDELRANRAEESMTDDIAVSKFCSSAVTFTPPPNPSGTIDFISHDLQEFESTDAQINCGFFLYSSDPSVAPAGVPSYFQDDDEEDDSVVAPVTTQNVRRKDSGESSRREIHHSFISYTPSAPLSGWSSAVEVGTTTQSAPLATSSDGPFTHTQQSDQDDGLPAFASVGIVMSAPTPRRRGRPRKLTAAPLSATACCSHSNNKNSSLKTVTSLLFPILETESEFSLQSAANQVSKVAPI